MATEPVVDRAADSSSSATLDIILAEHKALRDEVLKRMDHRITILVSSLTVSGAILGIAVERSSGPLLLVLPVLGTLFGLLLIYLTRGINDIGVYLESVERRLSLVYPEGFGWHLRPERPTRARSIFAIFHLPILLVTIVPSLTALLLALQFIQPLGLTIPLFITDVLLMSFYVTQYFRRLTPLRRPVSATARPDHLDGFRH